jgi:haloacetate dehalogenase
MTNVAAAIHDATRQRVELPGSGGVALNVRLGPPSGPPLLLLHGHPQTSLMWHKVWPILAPHYTLVAPDLRGYGDSDKPRGEPDHANYSKRTMGDDCIALMRSLGHESFFLLSHDRGARVAHRLAMDHPAQVRALVLMDIAPTLAMYEQTTQDFARAYWHWFFLIQPAPLPEQLLAGRGPEYVRGVLGGRYAGLKPFPPEVLAEYERCAADPATHHGICEDYRASAGIDLEHDRADRSAGRRLSMPLLLLWGHHGVVARCFDVMGEWRKAAEQVQGEALDCGHYLAEELPEVVCDQVQRFLGSIDGATA